MANQFDASTWVDGVTRPRVADFQKIQHDLAVRGQAIDGGGYGRANTGWLILNPGALPGTAYGVTGASWLAGLATLTIGAHSIKVNQLIGAAAILPAIYNGNFVVTAITGTTISFALVTNPGAYTSGGTVTVGGAGLVPAAGMFAIDPTGNVKEYNGTTWGAATTSVAAGTWYAGAGVPSSGSGSNGDMYLNTSNGDVYGPKAAGAWGTAAVNIIGPPVHWIVAAGIPASGTGVNGDMYLNSTTSDVYGPKAAGAWGAVAANIKGVIGLTGPMPNFIVGAGAPASGTGVNGDLYINSTNGDVYGPKAAGAWGAAVTNIRGPQGVAGSAINPRGAYAGGTTYAQFDGVTDGGVLYASLQNGNTGNPPASSPTWWMNLAVSAGLGDPGANGIVKRTALNTTATAVAGTDFAPITSGTAVLKGNGAGGFSNAVGGTDFAPITSGTAVLKGNGAGGFSNATAGTDFAPVTSGTAVLKGNGGGGFSNAVAGTDFAAATAAIADIAFVIDGGGSAITTGIKGDLFIDFACTINQITVLADQSGSIVVEIWKCTYAQFDDSTHPVTGDKLNGTGTPPTISTTVKSQDSTLANWTTSIAAGSVLRFNVNSCTAITRCSVALKITKT